jgi:hypothetical protein
LIPDLKPSINSSSLTLDLELLPNFSLVTRSEQVPPDAELAAMAIEDRRRRIQLATREIETALE